MTTAATVVAMVPLLVVSGAGAGARFSIGLVIATGMTIGTLFTLFVTPAMYTFLAQDRQGQKRSMRRRQRNYPRRRLRRSMSPLGQESSSQPNPKVRPRLSPRKARFRVALKLQNQAPRLRQHQLRARGGRASPRGVKPARPYQQPPNRWAKAVWLVYSPPACL